jgi:hypothetical protein
MYDFQIVIASGECISQVCNLLREVYPTATHISENYLDWQYNQNPVGKVIGFNAYKGQQLAAHYATIPVVANLFGKESYGLLSLNTATHPTHQGKRLFTALAAKTYEYGQTAGYEFVMGVANANSTHGFIKYHGFQLVAQLDAHIGLVPIKRYPQQQNIEFERLNPKSIEIIANTGKLGIQATLGKFDSDIKMQINHRRKASFILTRAPRLWLGLGKQTIDYPTLSFNIPQLLRPSPLNFIFKDLNGHRRKLNPDKVIIQAMDFDAY